MPGRPFYLTRADGAYLYDVGGNRYIDYHGGCDLSRTGAAQGVEDSGDQRRNCL
jgi:glutamate-1-semialdehyde aminotransferase